MIALHNLLNAVFKVKMKYIVRVGGHFQGMIIFNGLPFSSVAIFKR